MLLSLLLLISMFGFFIFVSNRLKIPVEFAPIFVFSSIISMLYLFSLIGLLKIGTYFLFAFGILLFFVLIALQKKNVVRMFTPGFTTFLIMSLLAWLKYRNYIVSSWDEFSHWGLIVKEMVYTGSITDNQSALHFKDYPPGMALFQYYISILTTNAEGTWFFARNIFIISAITTIFKGFTWKRSGIILIIYALFYYLFTFFGAGFEVIYIDAVLSALFGFIIVQYFSLREDNFKSLLYVVPQLFVLPLIKSTGSLLSAFLIVIILSDQIIQFFVKNNHSLKLQQLRKLSNFKMIFPILVLLAVICSPLISHYSWQKYVHNHGLAVTFKTNYSLHEIVNSVSHNANDREIKTKQAFLSAIGTKQIGELTLTLIGLTIICIYLIKERGYPRYRMYNLHLFLFVFLLIYSFGLYLLYVFSFSEYEGIRLASFDRYMNIYLLGWLIVTMAIPIDKIKQPNNDWKKTFSYFVIAVVTLTLIKITPFHTAEALYRQPVSNPTRLKILEKTSEVNNTIPMNSKTYIVWQNTTGLEFWILSYELAPRLTNIWYWSLGKPYNDKDIWTKNYSKEEWLEQLLSGNYEYVFIGNADDQFWNTYGDLFAKSNNYKNSSIFKVIKLSDGKITINAVH